jgi:glycosidase
MLPSFLDNHDTNRFLWLAGNDKRRLKLAALCQFTLRGAPIIYNGTEVGVSQAMSIWEEGSAGMAEARRPMPWGEAQDEDLRDFYRWLIRFRRDHPVIWRGERHTLHVDGERGTYVYAVAEAAEAVIVALNLSDAPQEITATWQDTPYTFTLPPWGGDVRTYPPAG